MMYLGIQAYIDIIIKMQLSCSWNKNIYVKGLVFKTPNCSVPKVNITNVSKGVAEIFEWKLTYFDFNDKS